jgi:cell fate regulator YaaT (PSP1 superfamily)
MGCGSCSSNGLPKGCRNNGSCGVSGCEKLTVFDWLSDMQLPGNKAPFSIVEVRFKNGRKEYFKNVNGLRLYMGDVVAVEGTPGHDIGAVSLTGELVRMQLKKRRIKENSSAVKKLYRKANSRDIEIWRKAQGRERETLLRTRQIVDELGLNMKMSDVEYQGDNSKAIFYYTAEERVDFRELIKVLAGEYRIRVEMRQIGSRQEAAKIGGIGSCGRELCCSTWLTDFRSVNTAAARYQQLSLNPSKLAGQCGKLKCCLNYELDTYLDALNKFPDTQKNLKTAKGEAIFQKMDIFKELLWYTYKEQPGEWIAIKLEDVKKIMAMNDRQELPESLELYDVAAQQELQKVGYENVVGQDDLTRFDKSGKSRHSGRNKRRKKPQAKAKPNPKNQGDKKAETDSKAGPKNASKNRSNRRRRPNRSKNQNKKGES